jgi:putative methionine-R-sulfoxide reductase with GAF domain
VKSGVGGVHTAGQPSQEGGAAASTQSSRADRLAQHVGILASIGKALAEPRDFPGMLRSVYVHLARTLEADICFLGLYDPSSQTVEVVAQIHSGTDLPGGRFPLGTGFTSQVIRTNAPLLIQDWSADGPRVQVEYETGRPGLPASAVTVPVASGDAVRGVLSVQSYSPGAFDLDDVALLQGIANELGVAISLPRGAAVMSADNRVAGDAEVILASMADPIIVVDTDGCLVRLNQAARALLCANGRTVVVGQRLDRASAEDGRRGTPNIARKLAPVVDRVQRKQVPVEMDVAIGGETRRALHVRGSPLMTADGEAVGGVLVLRELAV